LVYCDFPPEFFQDNFTTGHLSQLRFLTLGGFSISGGDFLDWASMLERLDLQSLTSIDFTENNGLLNADVFHIAEAAAKLPNLIDYRVMMDVWSHPGIIFSSGSFVSISVQNYKT
jgi:hypothetical protein